MIEVSSKVAREDWLAFNVSHLMYLMKKKRQRAFVLMLVYLMLLGYFGYPLVNEIKFSLDFWHYGWVESLYFSASKLLVTFFMLLFFCYFLFLAGVYYSPNYQMKKQDKQIGEEPFEDSRICITDESIATYSNSIDLRLAWSKVTKVVYTEKLIVLFSPGTLCIILSKQCVTEEELGSIEEKIRQHYSGEVLTLNA